MGDNAVRRALAWLKGQDDVTGSNLEVEGQGPEKADDAKAVPERGQGGGSGATVGLPRQIPLEFIRPNPFQPRQEFSDQEMDALTASIRRVGVLQPVVVRPAAVGFELVLGERRWRAAKAAGFLEIPALVRDIEDEEAAILAVVENVQRSDLNFWEEAEGYQKIIDQFGVTQAELALAVGRQQSTIANKLRLLRLPQEIRAKARKAQLSERHVRALLRVREADYLDPIVDIVIEEGLTVRQTETLIEVTNDVGLAEARAKHAAKTQGRRPRSGLRMIRDARILMNTFRQGIDALRKAGLNASMDTVDHGDHVTVTIKIPKGR